MCSLCSHASDIACVQSGTQYTDRLKFSTYVGFAVMGVYSTVVEIVYVWLYCSVFLHGTIAWAYRSMLAAVFCACLGNRWPVGRSPPDPS
jgi:hypothetical protein